ncbi:NAD(P)/FAD-dependent oxidoreductase [Kutzneria buriramensis]|uniref:NADPH-dependent 2,4-dienoyl-CoA reductase/sulfur reductase-like enzyme n=1 Tax=Kutzneria buriramensis TaxID=1045776 RepID=A0A3E0I538_9PSEU|nr:FAD/NAD(P)-binding oxidoreductase [Kutzneria buriramensis]REH53829.1 NADPH-dependent 2,4-dienoyl-CoA reductase/sulfur reductase-like enzyme [Kutzneria buriramensis]
MIAVVGASAAGLTAVQTLRREGYDGPLTVVGDEEHMPYDRPPLSKQVLSGVWEPAKVTLPSTVDASWMLGVRAVGLDVPGRRLALSTGDDLAYEKLVIATGVSARRLPFGSDLAGVHTLRTLSDALAFKAELAAAKSVVIVGAGFMGSEVAAVASGMGADVTVVDPLPAPMIRQFGPWLGGLVAKLHADHGVRMRLGVGVTGLRGDGRVSGVELADGVVLPADVVLVAIGSVPNTDWLAGSGLSLTDGVDCDSLCRAAPNVVAAGDVASWTHPVHGRRIRVEHRMNATEQGMAAARTLLGKGEPYAPIPYFWTDQYDVKIQAYGLFPEDAVPEVVAGDVGAGKFAVLYRHDGRVTGVVGWNLPRDTRQLRSRIGEPA